MAHEECGKCGASVRLGAKKCEVCGSPVGDVRKDVDNEIIVQQVISSLNRGQNDPK
jgi:uncharacterized membrane protein YvbJ